MASPGLPLVHVNRAFLALTGYERDEALGRNCRFLQGPKTEADAVKEMVSALRCGRPCDVRVTNYRKDGSTFANELSLRPVVDAASGRPRFYVATLLGGCRGELAAHAQRAAADEFLAALPPTVHLSLIHI